eukprot:scaffold1007_cov23-Cyclotella_meneghiniana.AAC.4
MQYKLLTLTTLPITATAAIKTTLRGNNIVTQDSLITAYNHGLHLPPPDATCLSLSSANECQLQSSADGIQCVWCMPPTDEESGMCLSRRDVEMAVELMAFPCGGHDASVFDGEADEEVEKSEEEELNKEMEKELADVLMVDASLPDFSCFSQAWGGGDIDLCHNSKATDGTQCQWCTASDDLIEVGVCVSLAQVGSASNMGMNCPTAATELIEAITEAHNSNDAQVTTSEEEEVQLNSALPDINCFRSAWIAENAEDACNTSQANDGTACVWCQTKGDTMGACVSSMEAGLANGQFGLTCPDQNEVEEEEIEEELEEEIEEEIKEKLEEDELEEDLVDAI